MLGYGLQLREKQKLRRVYGILESQFRHYFEKAAVRKGVTGQLLLQFLERRLDNVVYRMGLATSRPQARQFVRHGHFQVNGRKVNIPSFLVKPGDVVEVRQGSREMPALLASRESTSHQTVPSWIDADRDNLSAKIYPVRSGRRLRCRFKNNWSSNCIRSRDSGRTNSAPPPDWRGIKSNVMEGFSKTKASRL